MCKRHIDFIIIYYLRESKNEAKLKIKVFNQTCFRILPNVIFIASVFSFTIKLFCWAVEYAKKMIEERYWNYLLLIESKCEYSFFLISVNFFVKSLSCEVVFGNFRCKS